MKLRKDINIIFSFLDQATSFVIQFQYYEGEKFIGSRHWGIGFGLFWPPFVLLKGQEGM